jgi:hypothetical protein
MEVALPLGDREVEPLVAVSGKLELVGDAETFGGVRAEAFDKVLKHCGG